MPGNLAAVHLPFGFGHPLFHLHDTVRIERYGIDAGFDQKSGKVGIVTRCLTADTHLAPCLLGSGDETTDQAFNRLVALVKQIGKLG